MNLFNDYLLQSQRLEMKRDHLKRAKFANSVDRASLKIMANRANLALNKVIFSTNASLQIEG